MKESKARVICLVDIYDWSRGGHFRTCFRIYSQLLLELGHKVIALCGRPEEITEWVRQNVSAERAANFSAYPSRKSRRLRWLPGNLSRPMVAWLRWRALAKHIRRALSWERAEIDGVFLMYFEDFIPAEGRLPRWLVEHAFRWQWAFLSVSSSYRQKTESQQEVARQARRLFHLATAKNCTGWCILDGKNCDLLQSLFPQAPVRLLPDVTDEALPDMGFPLAREVLERAQERKIISLLGLLERRKGLLTLVRVAKRRPDIFFLFAGPYRDGAFNEEEKRELKQFLARVPDNCVFQPARIDVEGQFNRLVAISDILFTAYVDFQGSSNVMTKAAIFEKPVIVSAGSLCHERVERYRLGVAIAEGSAEECSQAIDYLLSDAGRAERRDYAGFAQSMSQNTLKEQLREVVAAFAEEP